MVPSDASPSVHFEEPGWYALVGAAAAPAQEVLRTLDSSPDPALRDLSRAALTMLAESTDEAVLKATESAAAAVRKALEEVKPKPATVHPTDANSMPDQDLRQVISWRTFSEVHRRHPKDVSLYIDYYPTGDSMLSASVNHGDARASLNLGGSLHVWARDSYTSRPFWGPAVANGLAWSVQELEQLLGLRHVEKPPVSTGATLAGRLVAAFLARSCYSSRHWTVDAFNSSGEWPPDKGSLLERAVAAGLDRGESSATEGSALWVVRAFSGEQVAVVSPSGQAMTSSGEVLELRQTYEECGRSIQRLVDRVFPLGN